MTYCPARGDIIWLDFDPQSGKEITKRRPALVLSDKRYNQVSGLCIVCPISSKSKRHGFDIAIRVQKTPSFIKADQLKSVDWRQRRADYIQPCTQEALRSATEIIMILLNDAS